MGSDEMFSGTIWTLEKALDLRSTKHNLLVSNVANKDTPNYKAFDLNVEEEMQKLKGSANKVNLNKTDPDHLTGSGSGSHAEIEISRQEITQEIKRMIYRSILTAVAFLAVSFVIVFILSTRFSKPLISLTESARKLSKGDFSVSSDIRIRSRDELGILGDAFIDMSRDL